MKQLLVVCLVAILCVTFVAAKEETFFFAPALDVTALGLSDTEIIAAEEAALVDQASEMEGQELPAVFRSLFKNERINVYISNDYVVGAIVEDGKITTAEEGALEDPTIEVDVSRHVFEDMKDETFDIKESLNNGDIQYEGVGFWNKIRINIYGFVARKALLFLA